MPMYATALVQEEIKIWWKPCNWGAHYHAAVIHSNIETGNLLQHLPRLLQY